MEERARRILESAIHLADQGGFQAVRLRDVAAHSGVALGTLYTRFRSKEDILVAALEEEAGKLETLLADYPPQGDAPLDRVIYFFTMASRALFARPNFARAVLRSVASGEPEIAEKVLRFHSRMSGLILDAYRGAAPHREETGDPEAAERLAFLLQQVWFGALVGWMGGMHDGEAVIDHMRWAARLLIRGHLAGQQD